MTAAGDAMLDLDLGPLRRDAAPEQPPAVIGVLTVCTGNVARSPLAEQLLRRELTALDVNVASAGTHALVDSPMTADAAAIAAGLGIPAEESAAHRGRWLREEHLADRDLVLAMTREQRRHIVELAPAKLRATFTVREFERLARGLTDAEARAAAEAAGDEPRSRLRAVLALVTERRGEVSAPTDPAEDDVIDPYRRSARTYELSAAQLVPGVEQAARLLRAALA